MHHSGFYTSGYASVDTMRVGDMTIENQTFEEATEMRAIPFCDDVFDSVLSLAWLQVDDPESSLRAKSPFHNVISQGLLQRNLFSLKLSEKDGSGSGELLFGDIDTDLYDGTLTSFPVNTVYSSDEINWFLAPGRQIHAHSIAYGHDVNFIANFSLAGYVAAFSTLDPYIRLPRAIGHDVLE